MFSFFQEQVAEDENVGAEDIDEDDEEDDSDDEEAFLRLQSLGQPKTKRYVSLLLYVYSDSIVFVQQCSLDFHTPYSIRQ